MMPLKNISRCSLRPMHLGEGGTRNFGIELMIQGCDASKVG
jgi:hypothetical protein